MIYRGDIHLVDLEPARPDEANKQRPCIIVSNDGANEAATTYGRGVLSVVPLTSNTSRIHRFQVLIAAISSGLARDSKAQAEQVRSVSITRVGRRIGAAGPAEMNALAVALRSHLAL